MCAIINLTMEKTENKKPIIWAIFVIIVTGLLIYGIWGTKKSVDDQPQITEENVQNEPIDNQNGSTGEVKNNINTIKKMTDIKEFSFDVINTGTGAQAKTGDNVTVQYKGTFLDGKVFDQGEFSFALGIGQVVPGFDKGVDGMKVGEARKIYIPSEMGYGATGAGAAIPPNTDLIFEVTLKSVN